MLLVHSWLCDGLLVMCDAIFKQQLFNHFCFPWAETKNDASRALCLQAGRNNLITSFMAAKEMELYEASATHFTKNLNIEQEWECVDLSGIMSPGDLLWNISPSPTEKGRTLLKAVYFSWLFSLFYAELTLEAHIPTFHERHGLCWRTLIIVWKHFECGCGLFIGLAVGVSYLTAPLWTSPKESKTKHQWTCLEESVTMSHAKMISAIASSQFCTKTDCTSTPWLFQHACTL